MRKRILFFTYGVAAYALFFVTYPYAIGFIGNLVVPVSIDGVPQVPLWQALIVNGLLLGVFAIQHSVMARPAFKRWWTKLVPKPIERSTYVLFSSVALIALFAHWQPVGGVVWNVTDPTGQAVLWGVFALGWLVVLVSSFLINHLDLFGLRQVWLHLIGKPYTALAFKTPLFIQVRAPSALRRLVSRFLGDADHDRDASRVRHRDDGLHPDRDSPRGTRSGQGASGVHRLS